MNIERLLAAEGWTIQKDKKGQKFVEVLGKNYPLIHPYSIHSDIYTSNRNPELKYQSLKRMHDMLWPNTIWHEWTERRFREHCSGWKSITWAGGAACGKSYDAAKLAILFWSADPRGRAVIVASTTLTSLDSRIWGYVTSLIHEIAVPLQFRYGKAAPPKITFDKIDTIHGMFTLAAARGKSDSSGSIKNYIGRHPKRGLMVILDEGTDLDESILTAMPNLQAGQEFFQALAIGNSNSKFDLHGMLSTPQGGWDSIDPYEHLKWETTQEGGVCLFFPCWDSPAIHHPDASQRRALSKFLITQEQVDHKGKLYGDKSPAFWRFVLGYWKEDTTDETVVSEKFITEYRSADKAEWTGLYPLNIVYGLDPAFSSGGDSCILQLAVLGQETSGNIVLDFRGDDLTFRLKLDSKSDIPLEIQIADETNRILKLFNCPLGNGCIDANGQGRALPELIRLQGNSLTSAYKIQSRKSGVAKNKISDIVQKTTYELWSPFRDLIQTRQIRGLSPTIIRQLTSRMVEIKAGKPLLESKSDYKIRLAAISPSLGMSPDEADAASLALLAAVLKFGFHSGQKREAKQQTSFADEKFQLHKAFLTGQQVEQKRSNVLKATYSGGLYDHLMTKKSF